MAFVNLVTVAASFTPPRGCITFSMAKYILISSAREERVGARGQGLTPPSF